MKFISKESIPVSKKKIRSEFAEIEGDQKYPGMGIVFFEHKDDLFSEDRDENRNTN